MVIRGDSSIKIEHNVNTYHANDVAGGRSYFTHKKSDEKTRLVLP